MMEQTVFLVDDDPSVLRTFPRALKRRGFNVQAFESAQSFLDAYTTDKAGCLVLDLSMPGMNGLELQEVMHEKGIELPIIFITGHGGVKDSVKALRAGAIDFLEKPFEPETLLERIGEAFEQDATTRIEQEKIAEIHQRFEQLTDREQEVLDHLLAEPATVSSKGIAQSLGISHRTVEQHRARILEKTNTQSLPELVMLAQQVGILKHNQKPD